MTRTARRLVIAAVAMPAAGAVLVVVLIVTAYAALGSGDGGNGMGGGADSVIRAAACSSQGLTAAGLTAEQAANAAVIIAVAGARGMGSAGAVVGVMTALTESSLINVDHGDHWGPDSRGLFQQRNSWGPVAVRMDPAGAAGLFFGRLETIDGWRDLPPWIAAQRVQRSAFDDGSNYAAHYNAAVAVVARLASGAGDAPPSTDDPVGASVGSSPAADGTAGFDLSAFCAPASDDSAGWGGYSNGLIPATALCPLTAAGQLLRCDAAAAWNAMSDAYQTNTGSPICVTDSYRPLDVQERLRIEKPTLAAVPGTSNHGWALAVDLCETGAAAMHFTTATYRWLKANAAAFGWVHPAWAEPGHRQEEPWHWEYVGGTS